MDNSSQNEKKDRRRIKKIFVLMIVIVLTGTVLIVETYAWFVGITTVTVNQFQVTVSTQKGLELSLDGNTWEQSTLTITEEAVKSDIETSYGSNTNKWTNALSPVSSSGAVDNTNSVLTIYKKSSLASTPGGYRLTASRITNYNETTHVPEEKDGYIAFDLFIRNGEGTQYNNAADEAIYLTSSSEVKITPVGDNPGMSSDYGLENSVRVAFALIGKIASAGATAASAQALTRANGSLNGMMAIIWEPNDTAHKAKLINYYNQACRKKTGPTTYDTSQTCTSIGTVSGTTVTNSNYVQTYTINSSISSSTNVDIYDGLNHYTNSINNQHYLNATNTFTDTEKNMTGDARKELFNLRANSITKVRVYIYLEGQDVDNYDLITKGKKIRINFGLTKDKFDIGS